MILLPAIDILDGKAVRLARGSFADQTVYDADPLEAGRRWAAAGARALHVVDLDGARDGTPKNLEQIRRITAEVPIPIQLGGGLRSLEAVREAIGAGAARVVLGTAAYRDVDFLDAVVAELGDRVVVSVDARDGLLAASGWIEQTKIPVESVFEQMGARGVRRFVYSSIERDGMLTGPDLDGARRAARAVRGGFLYSGGVSSLEDLGALAALRQVNLSGVIVGKALYEARFTIDQGQRMLDRGA
ncbi:MAG: 1-(5-phosphoribosyl)-5-[(5-phosphoribosylamino)methylideneamino]imidazole-4-carboxamide isomerase [Solirubrobacterales bacterium]|nr:1-(5-phosphoribosyl)-5-[(5-phosphoribosylamino)methylideneamino]imidazole-4-carboxamide isomerase [Solirubrobacterales bacterium]MBV9717105.1 1-(5-phosphoribosyl)-5-[(5-phosphoribosylamino)methylideneamino]imidazole-4-carboxamide isomerase [Solirubrobacterales bacterium]